MSSGAVALIRASNVSLAVAGIKLSWLLAAVSAASFLPAAQAYCYYDE